MGDRAPVPATGREDAAAGVPVAETGSTPEASVGDAPPSPTDEFRSGRRLRALNHVTEDGQRVRDPRRIWHDSALDTECWFRLAGDGKLRCLPSQDVADGTYEIFADPACQEPMVRMDPGRDAPRFVIRSDSVGCDSLTHVSAAGAQRGGTDRYKRAAGTCVRQRPESHIRYYDVGTALPPSTFMAAEDRLVRRGGRLAELHRVAEDGSYDKVGLHDTELGGRCQPVETRDGVLRCVVETRHFTLSRRYADPECKRPVGQLLPCSAHLADLIVLTGREGSGDRHRIFRAGKRIEGSRLYGPDESGSCVPRPLTENGVFSEAVEELDPVLLPRVERLREGARLQDDYYVAEGGARMQASPSAGLSDVRHGASCSFQMAADGKLRCLSGARSDTAFFADQDCTRPLLREWAPDPCPPAGTLAQVNGRVFRVAEALPLPPAQYYVSGPGECRARDRSGYEGSFCATGDEVPLSSFAAATLTKD